MGGVQSTGVLSTFQSHGSRSDSGVLDRDAGGSELARIMNSFPVRVVGEGRAS